MRLHRHDSGHSQADKRGHDVGERWAGPIGVAVDAYRRHFETVGVPAERVDLIADASLDALTAWAPDLGTEVAAVADGAGRPVRELAMLNARTEILARAPRPDEAECSTVVRVPTEATLDARPWSFQTWDWHPALATDGLLWEYEPTPGRWVKTFTEIGMLAKIGLNSAGLAVHFNILYHRSDTADGGVPVHAIARRILDEASTLAEAVDIARSARVGASTALTVLAVEGGRVETASLEVSPEGVGILRPDSDGWLVRTNHFLSPELADGDRRAAVTTTVARLDHLRGVAAEDANGDDLPSLALALCGSGGESAPICLSDKVATAAGLQSRTLLTVRQDPVAGTMECWPGTPYDAVEAGAAERV
ncbi:MAG TPA: C45 family peptidase [Nocardioidaceae bacterium]|nr:C45 family peptidase [Nocardioidaceae bacterium]